MNTVAKFEEGNIYEMTFVTDSGLRPQFICVKRTEKTARFERFGNPNDSITKKIKVWGDSEYIVNGSYSMAPMIKASRIVG